MGIVLHTEKGGRQVPCSMCGTFCNALLGLCPDCTSEVWRAKVEQEIYEAEGEGIEIFDPGYDEGQIGWRKE